MLDKTLELIQKTNWITAKTYTDFAPHEYILKKDNEKLCENVDVLMKKYGVVRAFLYPGGSQDYTYLYLGDYRYWYTGDGVILNRCPRNQTFNWRNVK